MLKVRLDYDKTGLEVKIPKKSVGKVFAMKKIPVLKNPGKVIKNSLLKPVGAKSIVKLAGGKKKVCIVISDKTRPVPNKIILPPLLELLKKAGVKKENITVA